jgi:hypothetical protein
MNERILRITRGETVELYRVRLLDDGGAALERFENGRFGAPRVFRHRASHSVGPADDPAAGMASAVEHVTGFLNGTVNVGERELLSPTSASTRNARWFPGDIQMLRTAFFYGRELFPSAQFHVTQLFRRVFGDVTFLALVVLSCTLWLSTDAPAARRRLAIGLQIVSMVAIFGFDRYWEPMRLRLRRQRGEASAGWRLLWRVPILVVEQLVRGTASLLVNTLLGLANLMIHPWQLWQAWRQLAGGRALEWKASSVSAGQDVRGWPLDEFRAVYRPAVKVGWGAIAFCLWLVLLGAPVGILGLNGLGLFLASFLTVVLYAWCSALPESEGRPQYRLTRGERARLMLWGLVGCAASVALIGAGLYPLPGFEGSAGVVMLFLSASALVALLFPLHYAARRRAAGGSSGSRGPRRWPAAVGAGVFLTCLLTCRAQEHVPGSRPAGRWSDALDFLHLDERQWRMPERERRLYEEIERTRRRHTQIDPEPLLRSQGDQPTLDPPATVPAPELSELRGIPAPRLPELNALEALSLPELHALPASERTFIFKPRRQFTAADREPLREAATAVESGRHATLVARRRAAAVTRRHLSPEEWRAQEQFIASSHYPWIGKEELRRLGQADATGESIPLVELARAYRWELILALWDAVPAARRPEASDRVRFQRLRDGIEGVVAIGHDPTSSEVARYLSEELALVEQWSHDYPHLPFGALRESPLPAPSRFSQVTGLVLAQGLTRDELATAWRLDYVDAYWNASDNGDSIQQVFRDRPRTRPCERFELDWEGNTALGKRWDELQTEQSLATRIWQAAATGSDRPTPQQLRVIVQFLARVLGALLSGSRVGPYAGLAHLFALDGVDPVALAARDPVASLWAARVWTEAMTGRVARTIYRASAEVSLPGTAADRALVQQAARERYPDDGGDPVLRRVLEWLVLVDNAETTSELAAGYDRFARELAERGAPVEGLPSAPRLSEAQINQDLLELWQELPRRFPAIPARDDLVAELLCHLAHFSSRNGHDARTPREFLDDFAPRLQQVNDAMGTALPAAVQALADHLLESTLGRTSAAAAGRRFFGWWVVVTQARALQYDLDRHQLSQGPRGTLALPATLAGSWGEILESGARRWPHLPWSSRGFAEFYLHTRALEGWSLDELWQHFGGQLAAADGLMTRHVVPSETLEALVERRIQRKTGALSLDPTLRRANAITALARLLEVARLNHVDDFDGNPGLLADRLSRLHERLSRAYPHLDWDSEGLLEWHLLIGLRQRWDLDQTVARFGPEWSLANTLAASGWLARLSAAAEPPERGRSPEERALAQFVDVQASRLEERTKLAPASPRARAMNALLALSSLILAAGEEGQIPDQRGAVWTQARVRAWASALGPGQLGPATLAWTRALVATWSDLLGAMRAEGPHFPWQRGSIVETNLMAMAGTGVTIPAMRAGHRAAWRLASELFAAGFVVPTAFADLVRKNFESDLRRKLAAARGIPETQVPAAELVPEDDSLIGLDAVLALAEVLSATRTAYGDSVDPADLARRFADVDAQGRRRFPFVPWAANGFTAAFVVAAHRQDFRDDPWKYAELTDMPSVDRLLGELRRREGHGLGLPAEVVADVRSLVQAQTGHTPSSDQVVAYQALRDGVFLLREFLPRVPRSLDNVITLARLRTAVRTLDGAYPELHLIRGEDRSLRTGFADRLAVLAMKLALAAGEDPARPGFVGAAIRRIKDSVLDGMSKIYVPLRNSLTAEEAELYEVTIREQAREDNPARAARFGLSPTALGVPVVKTDDLVADAALYEILYASEIGQDQTYLGDLFSIFGALRRRPEAVRVYGQGLAAIDARFAPELRRPGQPGYELWRASSGYQAWWAARAEFLQASRGQTIAIARTLALVKRGAFSQEADPATRVSFARFGAFDDYLGAFLDAFEEIPRVPELAAALGELHAADAFLADGMRFALALFECHVVKRLYPDARTAGQVLRGIAALLPQVTADYRRILGFAPRFESGVPLYDARVSFLRRRAIAGQGWGSDVYRRLNLVQRSVQRWTQAYFLEHAYKILFFRDLDTEDPTPVSRRARDWGLPRTRGDQTTDFLEETLPQALVAETGSRDRSVWIGWLMQHGELGLDGKPTGKNPYAEEVAGYEARRARYRERIAAGRAAGLSVRAEQQRIRDIEREYDSFQKQVGWLLESARGSARLTAVSRRDYREAIWLHALLPLVVLLGLGLAGRWLGARVRPVFARVLAALVWLPLALAVGIPVAVALRPAEAAQLAPDLLEHARLLQRTAGPEGFRPRGAAAQLARLWPERASSPGPEGSP